ncbi:MAG TPA: DMT family transporter [Thermoanaerobaculia bacterium]|nr:DMT family transporter [Thermoanaerobaculia bacterium]
MSTPTHARARLALVVATVIWGATFVVVQQGLRDLPVFHLLVFRFTLGALLLLPLALRRGAVPRPSRISLLVGGALFAGYVLQTYGLKWTTPSRSAFLTGISVVLVPLLGWATGVERPRPGPIAGALCAVGGLWALYRPQGGPPFGLGDWLTIGCAVAFAAHLLLVERAIKTTRMMRLAIVQFAVVALLSAPSLLLVPPRRAEFTPTALSAILITAVFATAVAFVCQIYAQRRLGAVETAVILTLEPAVAALVSVAAGAEPFGWPLAAGGALLVAGMLLAQIGADSPPEALPRAVG